MTSTEIVAAGVLIVVYAVGLYLMHTRSFGSDGA